VSNAMTSDFCVEALEDEASLQLTIMLEAVKS
jgi:hypothetical protein